MATRTTYQESRLGFVVDQSSLERTSGRQIDWANVADAFKNDDGIKVLPAGTVVGELLGTGKVSPRVVTTNPATGILETQAIESGDTASLSGYGVLKGGVLYENLLPDAAGGPPKVLASALKTELATAGCTFKFEPFGDSSAS